eukprot:TRINITY_DN14401_c0_g1_i10.p2 TRINITY_DN14401_c0_g1~~TRINITY_DN14401_c0_g1_i10.p2  ORF type:complete len:120 (+),score=28.36 TRINITY_DN14401_c0_g1_i10:128-487(+)
MTDSEGEEPATQYTEATTTHADQLASEEEQAKVDGLHTLDNLEHSLTSDTGSNCVLSRKFSDTASVDNEDIIDRSVGGFNTGVVINYVATLIDKSVQRRLRDRNRNKYFTNVVLHHSEI